MTWRGLGLLLGGAALALVGLSAGWPELTGLGAGLAALVLVALLGWGLGAHAEAELADTRLRVTRSEPATVRVQVRSRRAARLVEGDPAAPRSTVLVPAKAGEVRVPLDTSLRGERPVGPFVVVRGDPWSLVRRVAARTPQGLVLVRPKVHPVRPSLVAPPREGSTPRAVKQRGDEHFFALREYVLGDEPRMVHWRSSARSGRLVVKQHVASASEGTLIVLDTDASAYGSDSTFGGGFVEERFEVAVEVAASLCAARAEGIERVQLATTTRGTSLLTAGASGAPQALLDGLAVVVAVPPVDASHVELPALVRATKCAVVLVVTGTASPTLLSAVSAIGAATTLVRVQATGPAGAGRHRTVDVTGPGDLA